jgi:hypothetical protein
LYGERSNENYELEFRTLPPVANGYTAVSTPSMDTGGGLRLRAPRASRNDDLAVETTVIFRLYFPGQRRFTLPLTIEVAHNR